MKKTSKIFVAGHEGVVGSALCRRLRERGYENLITRTRLELNLTEQTKVREFFDEHKPEVVFLAAGQTGSLYANINYPAKFIYENLMISANVLNESFRCGSQKVFYFGCSSMYPKNCPQPMQEDHVLTGPLEPTSEAFAVAKIAGMMMCDAYNRQYGTSFVTIIPTNLYGAGLEYDPANSLVVPSLILRFHQAKVSGEQHVHVFGTGQVRRDFLSSLDLADATVFLAENYLDTGAFNVGTGVETSIADLATMIARVVGFQGRIEFDSSKPQGVERKLQNLDKIHSLGWKPKTGLEEGLRATYQDFLARG